KLLINVVAHLMTRDAERLGVRDLERGVEPAPEHDAADKSAECQKAEAEIGARAADDPPEPHDLFPAPENHAPQRRHGPSLSFFADTAGIDERIGHERRRIGLLDMAGGAEIAARRHI